MLEATFDFLVKPFLAGALFFATIIAVPTTTGALISLITNQGELYSRPDSWTEFEEYARFFIGGMIVFIPVLVWFMGMSMMSGF